jgi:RHS repeat-associated protein
MKVIYFYHCLFYKNYLGESEPKAERILNWMVVGEDYAAATGSTSHVGAMQIPICNSGDTMKQMTGLNRLVVRRNGWIYIYVSNESVQDVYFDNLVVNLTHGPLVEQKDYFAFGMENPALSTQAIKQLYYQNRYKFNGIDLDTAFSFNEYEAKYRDYDPEVARWMQIDPKPGIYESPYLSMGNNPILNVDSLGDSIIINTSVNYSNTANPKSK